jgi:hypothetical protein
MHRSRAPSIAPGTFFVAQSWAGCITNMPGFNLRQAQLCAFTIVAFAKQLVGLLDDSFTLVRISADWGGEDEATRAGLVGRLMAARRAVREAKEESTAEAEATAHKAVDEVKRPLGERGPL